MNDDYINFLISLTLAIPTHSTGKIKYSYKNGYVCPDTKISLDLAIFKQTSEENKVIEKIGIIFTSREEII